MSTLRYGTRGSQLALTQSRLLIAELRTLHPDTEFIEVIIQTTGDQRQTERFKEVGTKGMFVKEIEEALLGQQIDMGVHSLKDMPGELPHGLVLGAVPRRVDPRDALLSRGATLQSLHSGAVIGTSSLRRKALIRAVRPDLDVRELRGNLDTRIQKLENGHYDAIVLACAGLERMGWSSRITEHLDTSTFVPAPGQGALALEIREDDLVTKALLEAVNDTQTGLAIACERAFQATLGAGCHVPAGAYAELRGETLTLNAVVCHPSGTPCFKTVEEGIGSDAENIGRTAARRLLLDGAGELLESASD